MALLNWMGEHPILMAMMVFAAALAIDLARPPCKLPCFFGIHDWKLIDAFRFLYTEPSGEGCTLFRCRCCGILKSDNCGKRIPTDREAE